MSQSTPTPTLSTNQKDAYALRFVWVYSQQSLDMQRNRAALRNKTRTPEGSDKALLTRCPYEAVGGKEKIKK